MTFEMKNEYAVNENTVTRDPAEQQTGVLVVCDSNL